MIATHVTQPCDVSLRTSKRSAFHSTLEHNIIVVLIEHNLVHVKTLIQDQLRNSIQAFLPFYSLLCVYLTIYTYISGQKRFVLSADRTRLSGGRGVITLRRGSHPSHSNTVIEIKFLNRSLIEA